jgi:hypothetical protein
MRGRLAVAFVTMAIMAPGPAGGADPVAVLTEIQVRRGQVHVRPVGDNEWSAPKPLQSLRPGDQVRVVGDGRAVLVFTGGRGTGLVTQNNSPFTVAAQAEGGATDRVKSVIGGVTNFLLGQQRERTFQSLSVRSVRSQPPAILGPRETRVLPGKVVFEWAGADRLRYKVRLVGAQGVIWSLDDVERKPLAYPASAPALVAGGRYVWELETKEHGVQAAQFEVASLADATAVTDSLAVLTPASAKGYTPATLTLMRAGVLFQERFYADARRELESGIATSPDEPTLHLLLGHVYDRIGLKQQAAQAFDEAEALATR